MKNYIGITGVTSISDNILTVNNFKSAGFSMWDSHVPMIGFLVIKKTLEGISPSKGKIPHQRYPPVSSLSTIMSYSNESALNMVHYGAKSDLGLGDDVISIFKRNEIYGNLCRALQLNLAWPKKSELEKILNEFPQMQIVLQLPRKVLNNETNDEIAGKLKDYSEFVQGTIIDPSGGKKADFDPDYSLGLYSAIKEKNSNLVICFAGGNNHRNIRERITSIGNALESKDFSVDAEGGLRVYEKDKSRNVLVDMLEPNFVRKYFFNAHTGLALL